MIDLEKWGQEGRILKIARMGHPVLSQKAEEIDPLSQEAKLIIRDMAATIISLEKLGGLAAPQVFIPKRILFYNIPEFRTDEHTPKEWPMTVLVNASYTPLSDEMVMGWEACFSLPDLAGEVPRYKGIQVKYQNLEGQWQTEDVWGFRARVIQHEVDHLDGILYPKQMQDMSRFGYFEEVAKFMRKS